jgi:type VI protein secretion system component VasF
MSNETSQNDGTKIFMTITWVSAAVAVVATIVFFAWWGMKDRIAFGDE